jgi:hypothetical protein
MTKKTYASCRRCRAKREDVGEMSHTRLCVACSHELLLENVDGIHNHEGPAFERWRRAMAASVGAILVDDLLGEQ